jgi:F420-dependent methylenetetrahydromethanopterin dehydrogenase
VPDEFAICGAVGPAAMAQLIEYPFAIRGKADRATAKARALRSGARFKEKSLATAVHMIDKRTNEFIVMDSLPGGKFRVPDGPGPSVRTHVREVEPPRGGLGDDQRGESATAEGT